MNTQTSGLQLHLYVNIPTQAPNFSSVSEALAQLSRMDGEGKSNSTSAYPAPTSSLSPAVIHIGPGIYREKLVISRPNVTFLGCGETAADVVLVYHEGAFDLMPEGDKRGTFRTGAVRIDAQDFTAKHLTFQNDAGPGYKAGQALALYVDGDRACFENCRMLGSQDTIFTAPLPEQEFQPGGFKGPGEFKPRTMTRQYYKNCYIEGDVDFIFGSAICYFEGCTIFSKAREDLQDTAPKDGDSVASSTPSKNNADSNQTPIHGYITAASTPDNSKYGYVFKDCRLESDCPKASVYLGRPWREFAKTVFINCELGEHIHPQGWNDWKKTHGHFYFGEYNSSGPGANPKARADFSHQLTEKEAAEYTPETVLGGWRPL